MSRRSWRTNPHPKDRQKWSGKIQTISSKEPIYNLDQEIKKQFTRGSVWENRKGRYTVVWVGPEGIKIKYDKLNEDYLKKYPNCSPKKRQFISSGFETLRRINENIAKEKEIV